MSTTCRHVAACCTPRLLATQCRNPRPFPSTTCTALRLPHALMACAYATPPSKASSPSRRLSHQHSATVPFPAAACRLSPGCDRRHCTTCLVSHLQLRLDSVVPGAAGVYGYMHMDSWDLLWSVTAKAALAADLLRPHQMVAIVPGLLAVGHVDVT